MKFGKNCPHPEKPFSNSKTISQIKFPYRIEKLVKSQQECPGRKTLCRSLVTCKGFFCPVVLLLLLCENGCFNNNETTLQKISVLPATETPLPAIPIPSSESESMFLFKSSSSTLYLDGTIPHSPRWPSKKQKNVLTFSIQNHENWDLEFVKPCIEQLKHCCKFLFR